MHTITFVGILAILAILGVLLGKYVEAQSRCAICHALNPSTNHLMKHAITKPITGGKA
jgi:hypothetical protein